MIHPDVWCLSIDFGLSINLQKFNWIRCVLSGRKILFSRRNHVFSTNFFNPPFAKNILILFIYLIIILDFNGWSHKVLVISNLERIKPNLSLAKVIKITLIEVYNTGQIFFFLNEVIKHFSLPSIFYIG